MDDDTITLTFKVPTNEEATTALGTLIQNSNLPAENQISLRAWFTKLLQDAGRLQLDDVEMQADVEAEAARMSPEALDG